MMRFSINIPNEAGATWWDERRPIDDEINRLEPVLRRIEAGPPSL